ncbi:hypothetical protein X768_23215 [Mesorhizobium sp. LSJC265A00]|uniref:hypothetical protein n=1 Tax=Mesorhizobium sp. LSJC265A00 TaxID=1287322 RepID=UPI0003CDD579|nr:hypothetical protein [Mesorhizobium sp. LSJC265A00]ESX08380.1 hypothetical protein X768_23215 [Mesorhizobium sp. LSJC265A00]
MERRATAPPHNAQQGVDAHWQRQPLGEARCRAPAQNKQMMMDNIWSRQAVRRARGAKTPLVKTLGEIRRPHRAASQ